jgi:hypothetical protein
MKALLLIAVAFLPQSRVSTQGPHRMEIMLERREANAWRLVDPGLVLATNDQVRFRFKTNFRGFLYVTNQSTSGSSTLLFPRADTGALNRVEAGKEYLVPATHGAFRVTGPEGYDIVSWLVSPVELTRPESSPELPPPSDMKPRCDDAIFQARGECIDTGGGVKSPDESKGLIVVREKKSSVVSSSAPLKGPVVYEFHLAHR